MKGFLSKLLPFNLKINIFNVYQMLNMARDGYIN